tara:strand:- start:310 stop:771 length:462 start_codon:yes stop_codon:yes gene_type:complete
MTKDIYIAIPLITALGIDLFRPFIFSLSCPTVWFAPPKLFCAAVYLAICVLLGYTLKEANRINNNDIFTFCCILIFFNLVWPNLFNRSNKYTLILLFLTLLTAYYVYNEIFLSSLTDNENTLYLNLYSTFIVWLGFTITMVFEYANERRLILK